MKAKIKIQSHLMLVPNLNPLASEAAAGDGRAAAEGLELGVHNLAVVVNLVNILV